MYTSYLQILPVNSLSSCFVIILWACGERSWRSVVMVMVVVVSVLCVSADVFMTCAKRRQPPKSRVSALANSSQCVLIFNVVVSET